MKPAAFTYKKAATVAEAVGALEAHPGAKVIAGGQSLVPLMNFRLSRPEVLVDINAVRELGAIETRGDMLRVGALVRHQQLAQDDTVKAHVPVLANAARHIGHWAIRNRGTIGGSVVHADPAAELPAALVALGASVIVAGKQGERTIPAHEFLQGFYTTALLPDELVVRFEIPIKSRQIGFSEVVRRPGDFALVGAYAEVNGSAGAITWFGLGSMAERKAVEAWPNHSAAREELLRELAGQIDVPSEETYKYTMAVAVAERAYLDAQKEG